MKYAQGNRGASYKVRVNELKKQISECYDVAESDSLLKSWNEDSLEERQIHSSLVIWAQLSDLILILHCFKADLLKALKKLFFFKILLFCFEVDNSPVNFLTADKLVFLKALPFILIVLNNIRKSNTALSVPFIQILSLFAGFLYSPCERFWWSKGFQFSITPYCNIATDRLRCQLMESQHLSLGMRNLLRNDWESYSRQKV